MEENKIPIEDVLSNAVNTLSNLKIPIALVEAIGVPIATVAHNIHECVVALNNAKEGEQDGRNADTE